MIWRYSVCGCLDANSDSTFFKSLSDHLIKYYPLSPSKSENYTDVCGSVTHLLHTNCSKISGTYVNEHGKLVVAKISKSYLLGLPISDFYMDHHPQYYHLCWFYPDMLNSSLQKGDILPVYYTLWKYFFQNQFSYFDQKVLEPYAPGCILTLHGKTLIGRIWDKLDEQWIMELLCMREGISQWKLPSKDRSVALFITFGFANG